MQDVVVDGDTGSSFPPVIPMPCKAIDLLMASPEMRAAWERRAAEHVRPFTVSVVTDQIERQSMTSSAVEESRRRSERYASHVIR